MAQTSKNSVVVQRTTTHKQFGSVDMQFVLDFSNCEPEDVMKLAIRSIVIDIQRMVRSAGSKEGVKSFDGKTYDVKELLTNRRVGKTDFEKAELAASKLTKEELLKLMERYS